MRAILFYFSERSKYHCRQGVYISGLSSDWRKKILGGVRKTTNRVVGGKGKIYAVLLSLLLALFPALSKGVTLHLQPLQKAESMEDDPSVCNVL